MRAHIDGNASGFSVYMDMLKKTVKQAHGIADRLDDLESVLSEVSLPSGAFGSNHNAKMLTDDWNDAVDQRISDLKKLRKLTSELGYKIKYVVESLEYTEQKNSKSLSQIAGQIENEIEGIHKPGSDPRDPAPGRIMGEPPGPGGRMY